MYVIPRDGCPSFLSVELSIEDASGTIVDFAIDSVGAVGARRRAKLIFTSFDAAARKATLSTFDCS
jgi:hypothetical protein